jgi:hypothetical protein
MLRKLSIALAATLAIGAATALTTTEASAFHGHGGWHGGWHGWHGGWRGPGVRFYAYPAYGYGSCYRPRWVPGFGWRRVWVCG